ncbi:MAG: ATP-binding protein [Myxococcota bacterium]
MAFDLSSLTKGPDAKPPRVVVYGEHGLGKSTFAAGAPNPVFIQTEDGLSAIDTTKFPLAKKYEDVIEAITTLYKEEHDFRTVVLDSLDWLEALIWDYAARTNEYQGIEDFGYGKGYVLAADIMREVLDGLNALRLEKGMAVIATAHCQVRRFDSPTSEPYDQFKLKLHKFAAPIVQEWADVVGFVSLDEIIKKEDVGFNKKAARGITTGRRMLHLCPKPAYAAKNRFGLPDELPLEWGAFEEAMRTALHKEK